jgi:hypothetical protein
MKVFISYSTALDQIIAFRLQTMAAVYGMTVYVPPATTRQQTTSALTPEVQKELAESDVVLGVITQAPAPGAVSEMNTALTSGKLLIPIVSWTVPPEYYARFEPYFVVDPSDPSHAEGQIVKYLLEQKQQAENGAGNGTGALLALSTLAVALLLFASESK